MAIDGEIALGICNRALTGMGASTITSITVPGGDGTPSSVVCALHYEQVKFDAMSKYRWVFAKRKAHPDLITEPPQSRWTTKFKLPSDRLHDKPVAIFTSDLPRALELKDFDIFDGVIFAHVDDIFVDYMYKAPETTWPPYFTEFIEWALAAKIAGAIRDDPDLTRTLEVRAWGPRRDMAVPGGAYAAARQADFQNMPPAIMDANDLLNARFGGGVSFFNGAQG